MTPPSAILNALINLAHGGIAAAFCRKHGVKATSISNIINGKGNTGLSFKQLEKWANADGYTIGTALHPYTGDMITDALAHVKAAAVEARHTIEWQEEVTPEMSEKLAFLNRILETLT